MLSENVLTINILYLKKIFANVHSKISLKEGIHCKMLKLIKSKKESALKIVNSSNVIYKLTMGTLTPKKDGQKTFCDFLLEKRKKFQIFFSNFFFKFL